MKTVIIRERGQITIPESLRRTHRWANPSLAVTISSAGDNAIIIEPQKSEADWDKIWAGIKRARAIKGRGKAVSASKFIEKDRQSH